ncbi:MAG TPA: sugar ABC transporter ATP-binding protein [Bauldia sp.]|nr:sugar ABC transporter ATP-binding protein [Bauldia sp.]
MEQSSPFILKLAGVTKTYPGVNALQGVDFDLKAGEVHCLVGENGAGKSTLIRMLTGAEKPDTGTITLGGSEYHGLTPALGHALGVGVIYQESDLVLQMSVMDNIFLGHETTNGGVFLYRRAMRAAVDALNHELHLRFSPDAIVRDLGPAQRQLVQIAKALSRKIKVLVLDEPTAALTDNEIRHLFDLLGKLKAQGIGIIYVSHRLAEIMEIADRVSVMRDGQRVTTMPGAEVTEEKLIALMVGRVLEAATRQHAETGDVVLSVRNLTVRGQFSGIDLDLHKGEILGLAGLVGAGRSELLECLFGLTAPDEGEVSLHGKPARFASPRAAIQSGFGLVPEERRESGLVLGRAVAENLTFPVLDRLSKALLVSFQRLRTVAADLIQRLGIKTPSPRQRVGTLSGGNQQKVVIGKWLAADANILLLDEPTRGIDVNAKFEIYQLVANLVRGGVSVIMASSDLPELFALADRIVVLAGGRKVAELKTADTDQVEIMRYAVGATAGQAA